MTKLYRPLLFVFTITLGLTGLSVIASALPSFQPLDFEHYWTASRLLWSHISPYNTVEFFAPPWMALVMWPFILMPNQMAALLWLMINLASIGGSVALAFHWTNSLQPNPWKMVFIACIFIMPGSLFSYVTGQVSPLIGLAVLLLCWYISTKPRQNTTTTILIVVSFLITTLKPHLAILPDMLCILEIVRRRDWSLITGLVIGVIGVMLFAYATDAKWISELLSAWLAGNFRGGKPGLVASGYTGLQELGIPIWLFAPLAVYVLYQWYKQGLSISVITLAISVNFLIIPYSRSYDYVMLILPGWFLVKDFNYRNWFAISTAIVSLLIIPFTILTILTPAIATMGLLWQSKFANQDLQSVKQTII